MTAADLKAVRGGETKLRPGETKLEYGMWKEHSTYFCMSVAKIE